MTYNEAIKLYNGSRRQMAKHLDVSVQSIQHYSKNPERELPPARTFMIKVLNNISD